VGAFAPVWVKLTLVVGGTSGSYSVLARFGDSPKYIFTWVSRGAVNLTADKFLPGQPASKPRWKNRNVAVAILKDKANLEGPAATARAGATEGDKNIQWLTSGSADRSNAHATAFDDSSALVTWEEISDPSCPCDAMGCSGTFTGTRFQAVDKSGKKLGEPFVSMDVTVSGDMAKMGDGRICFPYVAEPWSLKGASGAKCGWITGAPARKVVSKMSFACVQK